ncbi:MAG: hypothetical protein LDL53_04325 [Candidatus Hydrogenedens sp.]|nr:hypothetical protein [Candidatus Hydrogenedens sp.]
MLGFLAKILFLVLITAYMVGEGLFFFVPLISVALIGPTVARGSRKRTFLLCVALAFGIVLGAEIEELTWEYEIILISLATFIGSAMLSISLGLALRRYSWAHCLILTTGVIFLLFTCVTMLFWQELRKDISISVNARIAEINNLSKEQADSMPPSSTTFIEGLKYLDYHWEDFHLGLMFGQSLLLSLIILGLIIARLRTFPCEDGLNCWENPNLGTFAQIRPTDYLVWLAILSAIVIIYDQHYGIGEIPRIIVRNLAVGLSFVYWLNGLSILVFCASLFQWNIVITLIIVVFVFGIWGFPLLATVGFFDTWWEFRNVLSQLYNRMNPKIIA